MVIPHVESFSAIRPTLLALQQQNSGSALSSRSDLSASGHSTSSLSVGSAASDSSDSNHHLADMRDRLIEQQVAARSAAGPSRGASSSSVNAKSSEQVGWKVTEATPPMESVPAKLDAAYEGDVGQSWDSVVCSISAVAIIDRDAPLGVRVICWAC